MFLWRNFSGANDIKLRLMSAYFPKLKIVGRGNEIIAMGEEEVLDVFEKKIARLVHYLHRYNSLPNIAVERIMENDADDDRSHASRDGAILHGASGQPIKAHSENQQKMVDLIRDHDMLFAVGPAGTGKTYTGVALAVRALRDKEVKRIILTRPAVEAGESLGFLPGDVKEKLDPYPPTALRCPAGHDPFGKTVRVSGKRHHPDRTAGLYARPDLGQCLRHPGRSPEHHAHADENVPHPDGPRAKFIITGDPGQVDLPARQKSGLAEALKILAGVKGIALVELGDQDVIRHHLVKEIIKAYKNHE